MTEEAVKQATCMISEVGDAGTGWLIAPTLVLTALHCVKATTAEGGVITVRFGAGVAAIEFTVVVEAHDDDLDVCLLRLPVPLNVEPIAIDISLPRVGEKWYAFGYPATKLDLGHALNGEVQQALGELVHGVDLDLSVTPGTHLSGYHGLSGAALMVGRVCRGMLRLNVDTALAALSTDKLRAFLDANGLLPEISAESGISTPHGLRPEFDEEFETRLASVNGGYLVIEGAHGIGKSTYCRRYEPKKPPLEVLGVYAFSERGRGITPAHQAQPEVFFDWVNSLLSMDVSGKPARLRELTYSQLIRNTHEALQALANRCAVAGKIGVLFIDGLNEAVGVSTDSLQRFVSLLPLALPRGLVIVITGVGLDAHASGIGSLLQAAERLTLPVLEYESQRGLCVELLDPGVVTSNLVTMLCERAKGHPLYLRYLADMVNGGASEGDIAQLPAFSGAIQDYYETLWGQLLPDKDAVNLLGIIARLRWGISVTDLTAMLLPTESAVYIPTLTRIQHLLSHSGSTEIYHPSFSEFVAHKTSAVDQLLQERLATFCNGSASGDYGSLNRIYHGLLGGTQSQLQAIQGCQQAWVDASVLLGAEPDVLLSDIDETLSAATRIGTATDMVRLLLLSQRLTFRYDTLFAQSAELVALALLALGKTEEALRHVIRNGRLIVDAHQAFKVVNALTRMGNTREALILLEKVELTLLAIFEQWQTEGSIETDLLIDTVQLRLHGFGLAIAAGGQPPVNNFLNAVVKGIVRAPNTPFSVEGQLEILLQLTGNLRGTVLCLNSQYRPVSQLKLPDKDPAQVLQSLLQILVHAEMNSRMYGVRLPREVIDRLLSDLEIFRDAPLSPKDARLIFVDTLIETGATGRLVSKCSVGVVGTREMLTFYKTNRADPDVVGFHESYQQLRASCFLNEALATPVVQIVKSDDWEGSLQSIACAIAWSDGAARRAKAAGDHAALDQVWSFMAEVVLPSCFFPLASRIQWQGAYTIPETVIPLLHERLAKLMLDCFPLQVSVFLLMLDEAFDSQLGLYNEGFRQTLAVVAEQFIAAKLEGATADALFNLVIRWRDYVEANVENRFELVPELLRIVPLLARLDSAEEAFNTYQSALRFSMGPSWYKEDQLSLMSSTLESLPVESAVPAASLAQIAAYLERASGEMTFQRYVRADKGCFIAQLCRRSLYADAIQYFKHQSCGSLAELFVQAAAGNLDRVSPLIGMRFPGGALEEQAALLALLRQVSTKADWRVRWALLEVYQHGDERHLGDWGQEYALIIAEFADDPANVAWAIRRIHVIAQSMYSERAWMLLNALVPLLPPNVKSDFTRLLEETETHLGPARLEQLASMFGLTPALRRTTQAGTDKPEVQPSSSDASEDKLYRPGLFGKMSVEEEARASLEVARSLLRRRNSSAAVNTCIDVLRKLQAGGWSIWSKTHTGSAAENLIKSVVQDGNELARLYGPLMLEERHAQRWWVASHLIDVVAAKVDATQQAALLGIAIEHVGQMVGEASSAAFEYLNGSLMDATEALFELLLWTLDHPAWERRDSGAAMLLWLASANDTWLPQLVKLAFSMDPRSRADIAAAVFDVLSHRNPTLLWQRIAPHVVIADVLAECRHVGRFVTLLRIAQRASEQGGAGAAEVVSAMSSSVAEHPASVPAENKEVPDYFPQELHELWYTLAELGVFTEASMLQMEAVVAKSCLPLSVDVAKQLETKVAEGFGEPSHLSTDRWAGKIRYSLNTALFRPMPVDTFLAIEAELRTYNPSTVSSPKDGNKLLAGLVSALENGTEQHYRPSCDGLVFLDLQSFVELEGRPAFVELISHLLPPDPRQAPYPPIYGFKSTELPPVFNDEQMAVCVRAMPVVAYFASLSPAIPTYRFTQLIGTTSSATLRYHWRDGSTVMSAGCSRRYEAALLAVHRGALTLPPGWKIAWMLRVNGDVRAVLNNF
ncbi:AVAST type 1 anti-phage system protease Avs1b [Pseudomonas paraversuta]|uniref:AVAST type 1 anti-phage system protease Avs1b n=1 Tax=Pseudomonas paraversuta TaxID=2750624 RepID=UPI003D2E3591